LGVSSWRQENYFGWGANGWRQEDYSGWRSIAGGRRTILAGGRWLELEEYLGSGQ